MFTDEEAQKIIALIYGDKPSKEIHPEDSETHYTKKGSRKVERSKRRQKQSRTGDETSAGQIIMNRIKLYMEE